MTGSYTVCIVDCLDDATALAFARGESSAAEQILEHLDACAECRVLVAAAAGGTGMRPTTPTRPRSIGRFEVVGVAGRGAMGIVYRGRDTRLDRMVALKVLSGDRLDPSAQARLEREARALARVAHPSIVSVYEVGDFEGSLFIAMEFMHGGTLEAWLGESRATTEVVSRFVEAGDGLATAHQAGLVHRDFKPANVMLDERGHARVTDFGLVSDGTPEHVERTTAITDVALTQTGMVLGTPAYMAPEQLEGAPADPRSDQFSFCVALFEALAGHRPFDGESVPALAEAVERGLLVTPRRPIPRRVHRALRRGLARRPEDRFPSMPDLLAQLRPSPRRGSALAIAGGVLVSAALAAGLTAWVSSSRATPSPETSAGLGESAALAPAADACADADAHWSEVWNEDRAAQLRAFEMSWWPERPGPNVHPRLAESWSGVGRVNASATVDEVRRFGDTWRSLYAETCSDSIETTTSASQLRRACLVDVLRRVDALVAAPPVRTFRAALDEHRTMLTRCTTHMVEALTLPEGETREAVERARDLLATAEAARFARNQAKARADIDAALGIAEDTGDPPLLAEVWLSRGRILAEANDVEAALEGLHDAVGFAQPAGHHRVMREAAEQLAFWYMLGTDEVAQSRRWLQTAERLDGRVPPTDAELARREVVRGYLFVRSGKRSEAIAAFERALGGALPADIAAPTLEGLVSQLRAAGRAAEVAGALDRAAKAYALDPDVMQVVARHKAPSLELFRRKRAHGGGPSR
jgi:tetratricopeptide (TPR) repeat protein